MTIFGIKVHHHGITYAFEQNDVEYLYVFLCFSYQINVSFLLVNVGLVRYTKTGTRRAIPASTLWTD